MDETVIWELSEFDPKWRHKYDAEKRGLLAVFGDAALEIEHIGSTSVDGSHLDFDNPDLQRAFQKVLNACERHGVVPGVAYTADADSAFRYIEQGFRFLAIGTDDEFLISGARSIVTRFREGV